MRSVLRFSISACCLLLSILTFAQEDCKIYGSVKFEDTNKKIVGATVTVLNKGSNFDQLTTTGSGKYEFFLPLGELYQVKFEYSGYMHKVLQYDLRNIPEEDWKGGFISQTEVNLMPEMEGFDRSILDTPLGKFSYDPLADAIGYDEDHTRRMLQRIADEKKRLEDLAANAGKLRKQFDELVAKGDSKVDQKKYSDAVDKYDQALEIFPDEEAVIKKRDDAQAKADELAAAAEIEQQYQSLIAEGQSNMKREEWEDARENFVDALKLKPDERLPKDKIDEIDEMLESLADREMYDELLAQADDYFDSEDYALSIEKYEEALRLLPNEKYPKERKAEAERILAELLASMMAAEELQQRYDDLIVLADKNFKDKDYETAKRKYEEASALMPDEQHPIDRIAECEEYLAELADAAAASAEADADRAERERIDKEYAALITSADEKFEKDMLEDSKADYEAALDLKSGEKYPKSRISRIDELLEERLLAEEKAEIEDRSDELAAAEELARQQREERDKLAEEERKRRMEEEQEERDRLAAERARKDEEERERRARWMSNVDTSKEDEVEKYYREARESEEKAKANAIAAKKDDAAGFSARKSEHADEVRADNLKEANNSKDKMDTIFRDGEAYIHAKAEKSNNEKVEALAYQDDKSGQADAQRRRNEDKTDKKKEGQQAVAHQDVYREQRMDDHGRDVEAYDRQSALYASKSETILSDIEHDVDQNKKIQDKVHRNGDKYREARVASVDDTKKESVEFLDDATTAADERLASVATKKERTKEAFEDGGEALDQYRQDRMLGVGEDKRKVEEFNAEKSLEADNNRFERRNELMAKDNGSEKDLNDYTLPEGAEDLAEGVTENSYQQGNKIVIERVVRMGNKVDTYRKVVSKTGTYYFKNNHSITQQVWHRETVDQRD